MNSTLYHQLGLALSHLRPTEPSAQSRLEALVATCFDFASKPSMDTLKHLDALRHLRGDYATLKELHATKAHEEQVHAEIQRIFDEMFSSLRTL